MKVSTANCRNPLRLLNLINVYKRLNRTQQIIFNKNPRTSCFVLICTAGYVRSADTRPNSEEKRIHLAANGLLVLLAALLSALVRFDAEAGPAPCPGDLTRGTGGFLLVLEELHQQVKLGTAVHIRSQTHQLVAAFHTAGHTPNY